MPYTLEGSIATPHALCLVTIYSYAGTLCVCEMFFLYAQVFSRLVIDRLLLRSPMRIGPWKRTIGQGRYTSGETRLFADVRTRSVEASRSFSCHLNIQTHSHLTKQLIEQVSHLLNILSVGCVNKLLRNKANFLGLLQNMDAKYFILLKISIHARSIGNRVLAVQEGRFEIMNIQTF